MPNLDSKYNLEQFQNAHNYYFTKNTLLFYVTSLGLSPDYICEKVNKLHLGVIFSKKNNEIINYDLNDEINKIQNYHKKMVTGITRTTVFNKPERPTITLTPKNNLRILMTLIIRITTSGLKQNPQKIE